MIEVKPEDHPDIVGGWVWTALELRWINERIAREVAAEREACAKVFDEMADQMVEDMEPSTAIAWVRSRAAAIRARGQA